MSADVRRSRRQFLEFLAASPLAWYAGATSAQASVSDLPIASPDLALNVLDFEALALEPPQVAHDLPAGARRLIQGARGYRATFVAGEQTRADGIDTGARPGRLARRVDA